MIFQLIDDNYLSLILKYLFNIYSSEYFIYSKTLKLFISCLISFEFANIIGLDHIDITISKYYVYKRSIF